MKKTLSVILVLMMTLICILPVTVSAEENDYVIDSAGLLDTPQFNILSMRCYWMNMNGLATVIVTDSGSQSAETLADASSSYVNNDGLIIAYDESSDAFCVRGFGSAAGYFTEDICSSIEGISAQACDETGIYTALRDAVFNAENALYGVEPYYTEYINDPVMDYADYLTEDQIDELNSRFADLRDQYGIDVAVNIDAEQWGDTAEEAADDTYDYYLYGNGEARDGIMLYISKEPRNYQFTTCGSGMDIFTDNGIEYLKSTVQPELASDDYYEACVTFADSAEFLLQEAADGSPYDKSYKNTGLILRNIAIAIAAALILAFIIARIANKSKVAEMNTAREQVDAHGYVKPGSFMLQLSQDVFLYSNIDRRLKPKEDSSGGGSHTSSSGSSHGGGGGSY